MHFGLLLPVSLLSTSALPTQPQPLTAVVMRLASRVRGSINTKLASVVSGSGMNVWLQTAQRRRWNCGGVRDVMATTIGVIAVRWLGMALVVASIKCGHTSGYEINRPMKVFTSDLLIHGCLRFTNMINVFRQLTYALNEHQFLHSSSENEPDTQPFLQYKALSALPNEVLPMVSQALYTDGTVTAEHPQA